MMMSSHRRQHSSVRRHHLLIPHIRLESIALDYFTTWIGARLGVISDQVEETMTSITRALPVGWTSRRMLNKLLHLGTVW